MSETVPELLHYAAPGIGPAPRSLWWWRIWLLVIALLAAGVYANSLKNGFAYDDIGVVRDNRHVVGLEWTSIWYENYWSSQDGIQPDILYRPLTLWSYLANQALTPGLAWPFHLVNVLLHALVSVLATMLIWRLLGDRKIAVVAGLLFAVHPLHTEVVANVVGRAELLAAVWSLLALLVYLPAQPLTQETGPMRRPFWHGLLVAACFFAAILSKETPATLLPAFVFLDTWRWFWWQRSARADSASAVPAALRVRCKSLVRWLSGQALRYYLPMALLFGIYIGLRINGPGLMTNVANTHPVVNLLVKATPLERVVTPFVLLGKYLGLTFWPVHLSADYSAPSIMPTADPLDSGASLGILTCVLATMLCLRTWKKTPHILLFTGLFFFSYFLISNYIRIGTIFGERLFYWPSVFVLALIAWAGVALCRGLLEFFPERTSPATHGFPVVEAVAEASLDSGAARKEPSAGKLGMRLTVQWGGAIALTALIVAMSWRTYVRNTDWADNITLAISTGRDNPGSAKACYWAGSVLIVAENDGYEETGQELLERAMKLYPDLAGPYWEMAKHFGRHGDLGKSLVYLSQAVKRDPGTHDSYVATHAILEDLRRAAPDSYMPALLKFRDENVERPEPYLALAMGYHAQGKWEEARNTASEAILRGRGHKGNLGDEFHEAAAELASIEFDSGRIEQAIAVYYMYVGNLRKNVDGHCRYAEMLLSLDRKKYPDTLLKADQHLRDAAAIDPSNAHIRQVRAEVNKALAGKPETTLVSPLVPDRKMSPEPLNPGGAR